MADKVLTNVKVRNRIDTSTNWSTVNPVLLSGEIGVVRDVSNDVATYRVKVGDGSTKWNALPFIASGDTNLKLDFSIAKSATSVSLSNSAITASHAVSEIVFSTGRNYVAGNCTWETATGSVTLTFSSAMTGAATGYIVLTKVS